MTKGDVAVVFEVPATDVKQTVADQLMGDIKTTDVVISHVGPGEPFGWTALARYGGATAGAIATVDSTVVVFNMAQMMEKFEADPVLSCVMLRHVLRSVRQRLHDLRLGVSVGIGASQFSIE